MSQQMIQLVDLVSCASDAAFAVNRDHRIVAWNKRAEDIVGYPSAEVLGRRCGDVVRGVYPSGEPLCTANRECEKCYMRGESFAVRRCLFQCKNGNSTYVSVSTLVPPADLLNGAEDDVVAVIFFRPEKAEGPKRISLPLRIFTLGHFGLVVTGQGLACDTWKRRHSLAVLKCLITNSGRSVHRDRLIEQLWPEVDMDRGWERLKVTVSFLRKQFRLAGLDIDPIKTIDQSYLLRQDRVWIDADAFERLAVTAEELDTMGRSQQALQCCADARRLYCGDYLEEDLYTDWHIERRERLREVYLAMLTRMANCLTNLGDTQAALQVRRDAERYDRDNFVDRATPEDPLPWASFVQRGQIYLDT